MRLRKPVVFSSILIFLFAATVGFDRLAGLFIDQRAATGLIFPPNTHYYLQAAEFSYTVETNSLGFRDREFDLNKRLTTRVLAIGNSFTYGWGVEVGQSWPKVLEARLRASGQEVEIANLGKPGGTLRTYAEVAEKATPLLKPDLLVIAVLQGYDLSQLETRGATRTAPGTVHDSLRSVAVKLYPHFVAFMNSRVTSQPTLQERWRGDARTLLAQMTPADKTRLEGLDSEVKSAFMNGTLNPWLVSLSVTRPDFFRHQLNVDSNDTKALVMEMARQLVLISNVARANQARVIVVSVPYGVYVSPHGLESSRRLGFSVTPEMLTTDAADENIRSASQIAGVPFYSVTTRFRQVAETRDLFFNLDGHFNPAGHQYFAESLIPIMEEQLRVR